MVKAEAIWSLFLHLHPASFFPFTPFDSFSPLYISKIIHLYMSVGISSRCFSIAVHSVLVLFLSREEESNITPTKRIPRNQGNSFTKEKCQEMDIFWRSKHFSLYFLCMRIALIVFKIFLQFFSQPYSIIDFLFPSLEIPYLF
jgi:hypothetical protein